MLHSDGESILSTSLSDEAATTAAIGAFVRDGLPTNLIQPLEIREDVKNIAIDRIHFSPKRPVQLQLTVHGISGWMQSLIAEWVGASADAYAQAELKSLRKSRRAQITRKDTESIVSLPEQGLVLRHPGLDSKLPGLRLLHNPEEAAELLKPFVKIDGDNVTVELVAHRLGKRAVLRITTAENKLFYVRLRGISSQSGSVSFANHQDLYDKLKNEATVSIPEPLGYTHDLGAAVFGELKGMPIDYTSLEAPTQCRMISRAILELQSIQCNSLATHTGVNEYKILLQLYARVRQYFPDLASTIKAPMDWVGEQLQQSSNTPSVLTHRDLHQKQILMTSTKVGVLDFDTVCLAHPALDLGNLQAHIYLEGRRAGFDSTSLEAALSNELVGISEAELSPWRCSALLRLAMIYAFTHEEKNTIDALVQEASTCL